MARGCLHATVHTPREQHFRSRLAHHDAKGTIGVDMHVVTVDPDLDANSAVDDSDAEAIPALGYPRADGEAVAVRLDAGEPFDECQPYAAHGRRMQPMGR